MANITLWGLVTDIRTERCARYCGIYAACLACFFYWNYNVFIGDVLFGRGALGVFTVPSKDFFGILLVFAAVSVGTQYSTGFFSLLWQMLVIIVTVAGLVLTPVMPAMQSSVWAGYLVVCAMFTVIVGPLFGGVEPPILHICSFACAIIVEFLYTPLVNTAEGPLLERTLLTVDNLWHYGIKGIFVNIGVYIGISCGVMLLPPWRTARTQLHEKAGQVLGMLADGFAALSEAGRGEYTPLMMPEISPELLFAGTSPSKDSIEELSSFSMLEPSFLHPGTLSAHPDAWKVFTAMLDNTRGQGEALGLGIAFARERGELSPAVDAVIVEAVVAIARILRALADKLQLERRGALELPALLDFPLPGLLGFAPWGKAAASKTRRKALEAELREAEQASVEVVKRLGLLLLTAEGSRVEVINVSTDTKPAPVPAAAAVAGIPPGLIAETLFSSLAIIIRRGDEASASAAAAVASPADAKDPDGSSPAGDHDVPIALPAAAIDPHGLWGLVVAVREIERQLQHASPVNVVKQVLVSTGPLQLVMLLKAWAHGILTVLRPQRLFGRGNVFRQPLSVYLLAQFTAGVWALLAASTFWDGYRNWQDTGGHGATWPLMAFLLVLQPTTEATIQKAIMRMIATVSAVFLAYGLCSVSLEGHWLIPISTLVVAPVFWLLPDSRSCLQLRTVGDLNYFCISFSFAYSMTMGYSGVYGIRETVLTRLVSQVEGGIYGIWETVLTRLVSQVMGCVVAIAVSIVIFPVSGVATATAGCVEALAEAEAAAASLARCLQRRSRPDAAQLAGEEEEQGKGGAVVKAVAQESEALLWDEVQVHLGLAAESCKHMLLQLASIRAYPISTALARETEGAKLLDLLLAKSLSIGLTLKLMGSIAWEVKTLVSRDHALDLLQAVEANLSYLASNLGLQRRQLHRAFKTRPFHLRFPHMPVFFSDTDLTEPVAGLEEGKGVAAGAETEAAPPLQKGEVQPGLLYGQLTPSMARLLQTLQDGLRRAVVDSGVGALDANLQAYLECGGGGRLGAALHQFHIGYLLYAADRSSQK